MILYFSICGIVGAALLIGLLLEDISERYEIEIYIYRKERNPYGD